jgi:hypothetical protein
VTSDAALRFARLAQALAPYADDIVFVGGWVHRLYLAEADEPGGVGTEDIDIALPRHLPAATRPTLIELAERAGFTRDPISSMPGVAQWLTYENAKGETVPIDFLTEGKPREPVEIEGQGGLLAQGYPGQRLLLAHTRYLRLGREFHPSVRRARTIRVPTLGAYIVQKGVSAGTRNHPLKRAKDIVYILEILRHHALGPQVLQQLPGILSHAPASAKAFRRAIELTVASDARMVDVALQTNLARSIQSDTATLIPLQRAWLRRLLGVTRRT